MDVNVTKPAPSLPYGADFALPMEITFRDEVDTDGYNYTVWRYCGFTTTGEPGVWEYIECR